MSRIFQKRKPGDKVDVRCSSFLGRSGAPQIRAERLYNGTRWSGEFGLPTERVLRRTRRSQLRSGRHSWTFFGPETTEFDQVTVDDKSITVLSFFRESCRFGGNATGLSVVEQCTVIEAELDLAIAKP